jgi:hypothetical protein
VELSSTEDAATAPWALVAAAAEELVFNPSAFAKDPSVIFAIVDDDVVIAFSAEDSGTGAELNALRAA